MRVGPPVPCTRGEALAAGLGVDALCGPTFRRLFHDMYAPSDLPLTTELRARAALRLAPPGAVAGRHTAATLWGAVVPESTQTHLTLRPGTRMRVHGIDARIRRRIEVARRDGIRLTSPGQTFVDLGEDLDLVDLVVTGDSFVRSGRLTAPELVDATTRLVGPGRRAAERAVAYVRTGAESAMETRLRLLLLLAGFPEPDLNLSLRDPLSGRVTYRLDLAYPQWQVAVEYDGRQHAESTRQWQWDVRRREELEADGWRVVVVLSGGIYRTPEETVERVAGAVRARGGRLRLRDSWRGHFPGFPGFPG